MSSYDEKKYLDKQIIVCVFFNVLNVLGTTGTTVRYMGILKALGLQVFYHMLAEPVFNMKRKPCHRYLAQRVSKISFASK